MKLLELRLHNFRQFYGDQRLQFDSADDARNVTVIHGFNGSGKTALLNSFVWCLYGETTPDLEEPGKLANERAIKEAASGADVEVAVELRFSVRGEMFRAQRKLAATHTPDGGGRESKPVLSLFRAKPGGEWERAGGDGAGEASAQLFIEQLLPSELYPFFFFNGERVERLAGADAYARVEGGVKTLLNIEIFARGEQHLKHWVSAELSKELKQFGNDEMNDAVGEEEKLDADRTKLEERLTLHRDNIAKCDAEIEKIEQKQSSFIELIDLTAKRTEARAALKAADEELGTLEADLVRAVSKDGYLAFAEPILAQTQERIASARQRGELPAKLKPQFVDDLMEKAKCICGRDIEKGSPEEAKLLVWREASGLAALEESIATVGGQVQGLRTRRGELFAAVGRLLGRKTELLAKRRIHSDELDHLNNRIGGRDVSEDAAALEAKRQQVVRARDDARFSLIEDERKCAEVGEHLEEVQRRIKRLRSENERVKLIQKQKEAVDHVAEALAKICEIQKQDVRRDLADQIADIWNDAAVKEYTASVSENFRLTLGKRVGGTLQPVHGASTGEKQVLALSFVGSLVKKAKMNEQRGAEPGMPGGMVVGGDYPLVMDSAFGSLEHDYQRKVAEWIPSLAGQVIVMASKSQWTDEVETAMRPRVAREYVLELQTQKEDANRSIVVAGETHPYVVSSSEPFEQTNIKEIRHGR